MASCRLTAADVAVASALGMARLAVKVRVVSVTAAKLVAPLACVAGAAEQGVGFPAVGGDIGGFASGVGRGYGEVVLPGR